MTSFSNKKGSRFRPIAANIAKLPELLLKRERNIAAFAD
jgi:hypothetical protein